jgi:hypothetical protein
LLNQPVGGDDGVGITESEPPRAMRQGRAGAGRTRDAHVPDLHMQNLGTERSRYAPRVVGTTVEHNVHPYFFAREARMLRGPDSGPHALFNKLRLVMGWNDDGEHGVLLFFFVGVRPPSLQRYPVAGSMITADSVITTRATPPVSRQ